MPLCHAAPPRCTDGPASLLRSSLRFVQDTSKAHVEAAVEVDCATFDRVLLYLEAAAKGLASSFNFDINTLPALLKASEALGCRERLEIDLWGPRFQPPPHFWPSALLSATWRCFEPRSLASSHAPRSDDAFAWQFA